MFPARFGPKPRLRPRFFLALTVLAALVGIYGCGTVVDHEKLQETLQASLEKSLRENIKAVECPADVSVDPGTTFTCTVIFSDDRREIATLRIRNEDADISTIDLKPTNRKGE